MMMMMLMKMTIKIEKVVSKNTDEAMNSIEIVSI